MTDRFISGRAHFLSRQIKMAISNLVRETKLKSPDKKHIVVFGYASPHQSRPGEENLESPSDGVIEIDKVLSYSRCGSSMAWSDDSRYLAVPLWMNMEGYSTHVLMIVDVKKETAYWIPKWYRYLEIESFHNNIVEGVVVTYPEREIKEKVTIDLSKMPLYYKRHYPQWKK